jgi:hypothetical protein
MDFHELRQEFIPPNPVSSFILMSSRLLKVFLCHARLTNGRYNVDIVIERQP